MKGILQDQIIEDAQEEARSDPEFSRAERLLEDLANDTGTKERRQTLGPEEAYRKATVAFRNSINAEKTLRDIQALQAMADYKLRTVDAPAYKKPFLWARFEYLSRVPTNEINHIPLSELLIRQSEKLTEVISDLQVATSEYRSAADNLASYESELTDDILSLTEIYEQHRSDIKALKDAGRIHADRYSLDMSLSEKAKWRRTNSKLERALYTKENEANRVLQESTLKNKTLRAVGSNARFMEGFAHFSESGIILAKNACEYVQRTARIYDLSSEMGTLGVDIMKGLNMYSEVVSHAANANSKRLSMLVSGFTHFANGSDYDGHSKLLEAPTLEMRELASRLSEMQREEMHASFDKEHT